MHSEGKILGKICLKAFRNNFFQICRGEGQGGVVACTYNPAALEAEFRNGVGSIPVEGNSPSIGGWIV